MIGNKDKQVALKKYPKSRVKANDDYAEKEKTEYLLPYC